MVVDAHPRQRNVARRLRKGGAIWWRVGTGKTRVAFIAFATIAKGITFGHPRFLVVCRREAFFDWENEMVKCGIDWQVRQVEEEDDLYGVSKRRPVLYLVSHGKLASLAKAIQNISTALDAVAYDEGFLYKNPRTDHCEAANKISEDVGVALILSGSMMTARNLEDIYGQLYAIGRHHVLAHTLTQFRSRFMFKYRINPTDPHSQAAKWVAMKGAGDRVARLIESVCSVHFPKVNTRKVEVIQRTIPATKQQIRAFHDLREYFEIELKGKRLTLKNAPSVMIKTQQVSDGWVNLSRDPDQPDYRSVRSSKLEYLLAQIAELIACNERVVIWCAFRRSVAMVLQSLQKTFPSMGIFGMTGGKKFDRVGWEKRGQVAVCTTGSGSSVNYFKNCAYAIYYSHSVKWLDMQQSMGRTDRDDSRHQTCFYYYLQTQGSMDRQIYNLVMSSKNSEKEIINAVNSWLADHKHSH